MDNMVNLPGGYYCELVCLCLREAVRYCYMGYVRITLSLFKQSWNYHYMRKSRHNLIHGKPQLVYEQCKYKSIKNHARM